MAIGSLPPVTNEIQANSGQPGKTLAQQAAASLLDLQATATAEPVPSIVPETTLIEQAVAEALGRQGGLASLYATLAELATAPDLPDTVKAAVDTLLSFRLGDGDVTPERVAQAIRSSGLFHEAVAAGKMAPLPPPSVRQALGAPPEQKQQMPARSPGPASLPTASPTAASSFSSSPSPPLPKAGAALNAPLPAAPTGQTYGRQGTLPAAATPSAAQILGVGNASGPAVAPGTPDVAVATASFTGQAAPTTGPATSAAGPTAPSANPFVPSSAIMAPANGIVPSLQSMAAEEPLVPVPAIPGSSPPSATENAPTTSAPIQQPVSSPTMAEAVPTPPASGEAAVPMSSPLTPPALPTGPGNAGFVPPQPASNTRAPPPSVSPPTLVPQPSEALTSTQPAAATSPAQTAANAPPSRSFAPWTPGRPLTSGTPEAAGLPVASSPAPETSTVPPTPAGTPTPAARPGSDRAPFVPSAVESLPVAPSVPAASRTTPGSAPSPTAATALPQPGAAQPVLPAAGRPTQPASQPVAQPGQQTTQASPAAPLTGEMAAPARQVSLPSSVTPTAPAAIGVDLKGALEMLRRELVTWLGRNADVMAGLDGAANEAPPLRVDRPSPPRKNGPVRGQPAISLFGGDEAGEASTEALAGRALGEAERSLSRVFLHQAATAESRDTKATLPTQALMLEIPIAGPNGTSIAQLRIERDDHAPTEPGAPPRRVFQVDIAFDIVPLGPVAVRVGLMDGRRVAVGVWCESDDGLVRMEAERENIVLGLEQEGMVVAGVDLHRGHPPEGHDETAAASHRLDLQL